MTTFTELASNITEAGAAIAESARLGKADDLTAVEDMSSISHLRHSVADTGDMIAKDFPFM